MTSSTARDVPPLILQADFLTVREVGPWLRDALDTLVGPERAGELLPTLELAVQELCINVVDHALQRQPGRLELRARLDEASVTIELFDEGEAFDPALVTEPDPDKPRVRGYGLMIVRRLAEELRYERLGATNHWIVQFPATRRDPAPPAEGQRR